MPVRLVKNPSNSRPYLALVWIEHALAGDAVCEEEDGENEDEEPEVAKLNEIIFLSSSMEHMQIKKLRVEPEVQTQLY